MSADAAPAARAAVYCRVSTDDQAEHGYSLAEQERRGREQVSRAGWSLLGVYVDEGVSGKLISRPELDRMLADLAPGDLVVVNPLDRLGRDALRDLMRMIQLAGARVVADGRPVDYETPEGRFTTNIMAEVHELERRKIAQRTSRNIAERGRAGKPWGVPKLGYAHGEDGSWVVVPAEAEIVRRVFALRIDGLSYQAVARALNDAKVYGRGGGKWSATGVKRVVDGRHALGEFRLNGEWVRGRHDPLISEETWLAAQAIGEAARAGRVATARPGRRPKRHLFVGGLLRCSLCGEAMVPRSDSSDRYVCATNRRHLGPNACAMPSHRRADVDGRFLALFERAFLDLDATREHVAAALDQDLADTDAQLRSADLALAEVERRQQRADEDYFAGALSAPSYERFAARLAEDTTAAAAERDRLARRADEIRADRVNLDAESITLRRLAQLRDAIAARTRDAAAHEDVETLRAVVAKAFERVFLGPDGQVDMLQPGVGHATPFLVLAGDPVPAIPDLDAEMPPRLAVPLRPARQMSQTAASATHLSPVVAAFARALAEIGDAR